ncbi:uncharacterized protein P174DRAFT_449176 [Aspergillus novofumigatus IBT 16806]|uniref:Protein kinase domain-containing protein n=1 Tax=Aspergillus novofumigatus (strain IBT 16806) TaxID=1392255 RepID=A0A2I1CIW9_ASPN1|nr:uncharacterized protein P174DRAFT_449176 [Aspergillus novofumigatus IBT 16806]PKX97569.1 hypothetical protein P174DRAFT_449176 [Aspergillus novofumigatus IBT 16806]
MELAQTQLARAVPPLRRNAGTSNPSIHSDRLALTFMSEWRSFTRDAFQVFREAGITHEVPFHDETELYTVGNELGVSGRFVRNLCDPVMKALAPLPGMASIRFADFQASSTSEDVVPDVCLGLIAIDPTPDNVYLVGELKTPWTIPDAYLHLNRPTSYRLEPLIGQLVAQMRTCSLRFGFLSTYNSTVFVKRAADCSFLLSPPIKHDTMQPSLRQLFAGFCLMALSEPKYFESPSFQPRDLRGPPPLRVSARLLRNPDEPPLSLTNELDSVTSNSVIVNTDRSPPTVINCVRQLSDPTVNSKATWLATINGTPVVLKCWQLKYEELFDAEAAVYDRVWTQRPAGVHNFAKWILRGEIVCSSIFPSGYVLVLEHRDGMRLDRVWHTLSEIERAHVQSQCLNGIHALRQVTVRLDDAGMHNILYSRESGVVTLLDFESAQEVESHSVIPAYYEMGVMFGSDFLLGRPSGG